MPQADEHRTSITDEAISELLDADPDFRNTYLNEPVSHATVESVRQTLNQVEAGLLRSGVGRDVVSSVFRDALITPHHNHVRQRTLMQDMNVPPKFVCPKCIMPSWNPNDALNGYCGHCHAFTGPKTAPATAPQGTP